jgi:hypothetical protein
MHSAFGVEHGAEISKVNPFKARKQVAAQLKLAGDSAKRPARRTVNHLNEKNRKLKFMDPVPINRFKK